MKPRLYILLIISLGVLACSSPQKLYEKGKYFKAFDGALNDLNDGKKDRKAVVLLNKSFAKMIDIAKEEMIELLDGYQVNDLKHNFKKYHDVNKRYVKGERHLDVENKDKFAIFIQDKEQLLTDTYEEGKDLMVYFEESKNKIDARNAYYHFELVKEYGSNFPDIDQLMNEAKSAATVIYNVDADLDSDFSYQWDVDGRFDDLEGEDGFVQIVYDNNSIKSDCEVELDFSRLDVDERSENSSRNYTKEILDGYRTETDTSGNSVQVPIYKEVSGTVTTRRITKTVSWRVDVEINRSTNNCDLREERFTEEVEDKIEIYELSGDERAIPNEFKDSSNQELKDTDDMVEDLIDDLYRRVRNYFY